MLSVQIKLEHRNLRHTMFARLSVSKRSCLLQFVVITFWGLYAVDRELVYPAHLDKIIPWWLNHVMVRTPPCCCCAVYVRFT